MQPIKKYGVWFVISFLAFVPPVPAETSILLSLMNSTQSVVSILSETGVLFGEEPKPVVHAETGAVLVQRSVRPVIHTRTGTGIILDGSGLVVTNAHVVQQAGRVTVTLFDESSHRAEIIHVIPDQDIAFLRILPTRPLLPVSLANSETVQLDDRVYTIGGSSLLKNTISEGVISGIGVHPSAKGNAARIRFLRVTFNIYQGDSGTPLFDAEGRLIGIMIGAATEKNKVAYAIPSIMIIRALQENREKFIRSGDES